VSGRHNIALAVILGALAALPATPRTAGDEAPAPVPQAVPAEKEPRIGKVGEDLYQIGTVVVNARERTIRCPGEVNMDEGGPIELLACTEKGKVHESVFILHIVPMDLQIALLLLNMEQGRNPAAKYWEDDPDGTRPPGDAAAISVEWRPEGLAEGDPPSKAPAERFLYNVQTDTPLAEADWVFTGSKLYDGQLAADLDGTIVTTFHDPVAILELNHETVNDDIYYVVNRKVCPKAGTKVELVVRPVAKPEKAASPAAEAP
jgi:hypothetical protein